MKTFMVLLLMMGPVAAEEIPCSLIRTGVKLAGVAEAERLARSYGATDADVEKARLCLTSRHRPMRDRASATPAK